MPANLLVARVRLGLASVLLLIPLIDAFFFPDDPKEAIVGISLTCGTFLVSLIVFILIRREYNPTWLSFASSSYDVTLVSCALALFLVMNEPHTAVNSKVVFEGYFLAIASTSLRYDKRICITAGLLAFAEYLTIIDLLILLFTLYWSYRYTRLGRQMLSPDKRPPESTVLRTVWIGVTVSTVGMLFSMLVLLIETSNMLFIFLRAPQGGVPMIQTGPEAPYWVSSVDMGSLMALVLTLFAELIVLVLSLWLLFRTTMGSPEFPEAADGKPPEAVPEAPLA